MASGRFEQPVDRRPVADVHALEHIVRGVGDRGQRVQVGRVGEFVQHDNVEAEVGDEVAADSGADKSGAAGDENAHVIQSADDSCP
jgi:hypothetical protein